MRKLKETILASASQGLRGETSQATKDKIEGLIRGEKARTRREKEGRKSVKSGRRSSGGGWD